MYILEGNIGCGKSTFLKLLSSAIPDLAVVYEPLSQWQKKFDGQSLLASFYQDPKRWAYAMESGTMLARIRDHIHEQTQKNQRRIMERSVYSGCYCFALNSYRNGFLSDLEWNIYQEWFSTIVPLLCKPPQGFIYLSITPAQALERIRKRNRPSEESITLTYLEQLHECYRHFLIEKKDVLPELVKVPVIVLQGDGDFEKDLKYRASLIEQVTRFIDQTSNASSSASSVTHEQHSFAL